MFTDLKSALSFVIPFLLVLNESICHGVKIHFYQKENYKGHLFQSDLKTSCNTCNNVSGKYIDLVASIKTDTCLMVYTGSGCSVGHNIGSSFRINPPGDSDLYAHFGDLLATPSHSDLGMGGVRSYHACNETEGGNKLDVDIYTYYTPKVKEIVFLHPFVTPSAYFDHDSYRDVCSCQNLPHKTRQQHKMTILNHGNELLTFEEEDCSGPPRFIPAGYSNKSTNLIGVKSISAYEGSPAYSHCFKLSATVYKFELFEPAQLNQEMSQETVEFAAPTAFTNDDGEGVKTEEYSVTKTIGESVDVEIASSLSNMHQVGVEEFVEMETTVSIPFLSETKFKLGLKTSFSSEEGSTNWRSEIKTIETTRAITRTQTIQVTPCTEYTIHGIMTRVKNKQIDYRAHVKITGTFGNERLTARKIKMYLDHDEGLEYVKDFDEFMVIAIAHNGTMKAEYIRNAVLKGTGRPIPGCVAVEASPSSAETSSMNNNNNVGIILFLFLSGSLVAIILYALNARRSRSRQTFGFY